MGCRIHQQHAQKHDMACDSTSLGVVNLYSQLWADLILFDVVEAVGQSASSFDMFGYGFQTTYLT